MDERVIKSIIIDGETAIKPFFYLKNKKLHCRYTVDKCILLSDIEDINIKEELSKNPENKQEIFKRNWISFVDLFHKKVLDGIQVVNEYMERKRNLTK